MNPAFGARIECLTNILNVRPHFSGSLQHVVGARASTTPRGGLSGSGAHLPLSHRLWAALLTTLARRHRIKLAVFLLLALVVSGCATPGTRTDSRDYAVSTCRLTSQEIELAQKRARNYLKRHSYVATDVRLLAVIADSVFPSEVQDLWVKLGRSQTSSSAYLQRRGQSFKLWCVAIIDRSTQSPITTQGYLLSNTPDQGEIVQLGGYRVLYVGRGS
jgi:hypothetical protein